MKDMATNKEKLAFIAEWKEIQRLGAAVLKANGHDIRLVPIYEVAEDGKEK